MAVQNDTSRIQYNGNNSTVNAYAIPFPFFENAHIRCVVTDSAGADTELTLGSGFTLTGAGNPNGGSLLTVAAVPNTSKVTIFRTVPATQTTSYQEGGDFPAASHERALDKLTMIAQQTKRLADRALKVPETQNNPNDLPNSGTGQKLLTSTNGTLGWDENRNPPPYPATAGTQALVTAGSGAAPSWQTMPAIATGPITATGSTTPRFVSDRFADMVNVRDFGAIGNGLVDDGPAIRLAVASGVANNKAVYFPKGTYLVSTTTTGATALTSVSGYAVEVINNSTTIPQSVVLVGDGATITSPLYPQQNNANQAFTFFQIDGFFSEIRAVGLHIVSTSPVANSASSKGRVYGFFIRGSQANLWSQTIRAQDVTATNCSFKDCLIGMRVDNAENLTVEACLFLYSYGYASVGASDWSVGLGIRQTRNTKVSNCYFNGHTQAINPTLSQNPEYNAKSADGFILASGPDTGNQASFIVTGNFVSNFSREGIYIAGFGNPHNESSHDSVGPIVTNNVIRGAYPAGHVPAVNWGIRLDASHAVISNNVLHKCHTGILCLGNVSYGGTGHPHFSLITSNSILLADADTPGYIGTVGAVLFGNNIVFENNTIVGKNIGSYRTNGWGGEIPKAKYTIASTNQTNDTITVNQHPYSNGDSVRFVTAPGGSGVTTSANYFVINKNGDTFSVATSFYNDPVTGAFVGTPVNITADLTGVQIEGGILANPCALNILGPGNVDANNTRVYVRNNVMRIVSKKTSSVFSYAIEPNANSCEIFVENNLIEGFDYVLHREGGSFLPVVMRDNTVIGALRMTTGYNYNEFFGAPFIQRHSFTIYPTQAGWYEIPVNAAYAAELILNIKTIGTYLYGDTTSITQNGGQSTEVSVAWYDEVSGGGNANTRLFMSQKHVGTFPAVSKAYGRVNNANLLLYVYVNRVLTKAALSFSGGGGSGAAGYASIANGVVQSVTITNPGSGYTSAPSVSIADANKFGRDIVGTGASFSAVLSGNTVNSVTVNSGGSGYAQAIEILAKSEQARFGVGLLNPRYTATTPSSGMEMVFSAGSKNMLRSGGFSGTITGSGDPVLATTAPSSSPEFIGQQFVDTSTGIAYLALGTSSSADWKALATWNP